MKPELYEDFSCLFDEELDSWFSADIACCDECYDDFCKQWPLIYLRDIKFQESLIPLDAFWSGSKFGQLMPEAVFMERVQGLECPRCGAPLRYNIWPYSFPFKIPREFEFKIGEIGKIPRQTPFLVLSYPFAQQILEEIQRLGTKTKRAKVKTTYFRARHAPEIVNAVASDLLPPPPEKTSEGRYNHNGLPALYLGSSKECCILEIGNPGERTWVAEVRILAGIKTLDMRDTEIDTEIISALVASSLISAPAKGSGWNKPEYVFSRFVADCASNAGFDAIRYPSTKSPDGDNLVLLNRPEPWESVVEVKKISKGSKS